jgi:methylated-DNA-protein-cysteine methyltransferase-like protein
VSTRFASISNTIYILRNSPASKTQVNVPLAQRPRQVGVCLKHLPSDPSLPHHNANVPWQRVINAKGIISPRLVILSGVLLRRLRSLRVPNRGHPSGAAYQATVLQAEGVSVTTSTMGEFIIDFSEFGWFPKQLPSEEAAGLEPHVFTDDE